MSLADRVDRRARMRRRLGHFGLLEQMQFVDAVRTAEPHSWKASWRNEAGRATFASHLKALRMLLADPAETEGGIVFEDDILPHNEFVARLGVVLENLPEGTRFCSLGYMIDRWDRSLTWSGQDPARRNLARIVPGATWGMHAYWIARPYAEEVLAEHEGRAVSELPTSSEVIAFESGGFVAYPPLVLQDAVDSTLRPQGELDFHIRSQEAWSYADYSECEDGEHCSPLAGATGAGSRTIALCMIVRDEAAVIERCLLSVRPLIDTWVICDTGSTDVTVGLIEQVFDGVPGQLHRRPWRDFGWNRSELMSLASGAADYLLLLDADMTIEWLGPLPPLRADSYLLLHDDEPAYRVPRLVRGDRHWWFSGSTHEYLAGEGQWSEEPLDALVVRHHGDGSSRAIKLERDADLLARDVEREPENARAVFYLAQTMRDLGQDERAIELYERRVEMGGWDQERFYAAYRAGSLRARRDDDRAVAMLVAAWQLRPQRGEPLYELARFCRFRGWWQAAYVFAGTGAALPLPDDALFVHRWIYEWGLRFELAVAAYWVGALEQALVMSEGLLGDPRLPGGLTEPVRDVRSYAVARGGAGASAGHDLAPALKALAPSFEVAEVKLEVLPAWPQFNPTIAADGEGFRIIVRTANYRIVDGRYRWLTDERDVIRTLNYLVFLDRELAVTEVRALEERADGPQRYPSRVHGYEDCRLVQVGAEWLASATVRDRNPLERCEMALLQLERDAIAGVTPLRSSIPAYHEKNWMPFSVEDQLYFVYSTAPTVVVRCDLESGLCPIVASHPLRSEAQLRGGSQGITLGDGVLFLVHEATEDRGRRIYSHRFVLLDRDHRVAAASRAFHLLSPEIEFCAGLAQRDGQLLVTFGVGDHTAMLGVVEAGEVLALLEPVAAERGLASVARPW